MRKVLFILSELADADVDWMIEAGTKTAVPVGTVLIEEGKPIEVLYVVLDGQLAVTLAALDGKEIARLQSGEILGELSYLDSRPPSATVTAVEPSTLLSGPRARLSAKLEEDAAFAARFYRALGVLLASRLRKSQQRLGYDSDRILDDETEHEDELDPDLLEHVALAGARFDWMLKRLREASPDEPSREGR
jgi:CRP/FNR family cyclic AMP-dependent transcriptional regulator